MATTSILVATDFSDLSRRALRAADQMAALLGGRVVPLHAYEPITSLDGFHFYGPSSAVSGEFPDIAREVPRALSLFAAQDVDPARLADGIFVTGSPAPAIARASLNHDLVVLSSHGRSGISRFLLGSVADRVVQVAPGPVLLVHDEPALAPLRRIVVATDLSANSTAAFRPALRLSRSTGASVEFVHVRVGGDGSAAATRAVEDQARASVESQAGEKDGGWKVTVLPAEGSVEAALSAFLRDDPAGLVVMSSAGGSATQHHLLGRAPAHLIRAVNTPVLLVTPDAGREARVEALRKP